MVTTPDICHNQRNRWLCKNIPAGVKFFNRNAENCSTHSGELYTQFCRRKQLLSRIYALSSVKFLGLKSRMCKKNEKCHAGDLCFEPRVDQSTSEQKDNSKTNTKKCANKIETTFDFILCDITPEQLKAHFLRLFGYISHYHRTKQRSWLHLELNC